MSEKVIITKEMLEKDYDELTAQEEENLYKVVYDIFKYDIDYALYNDHIDFKIIETSGLDVEITKIYDYDEKDVNLRYDFNNEYGTLLTLCTDLDYACYNSDIELWNAICKDENLINNRNVCDIYSESIYFLFSDIENQIWRTSELLNDDDIWEYINYYEYIDLIDTDELYDYISLAINELDKWVNAELNHFFIYTLDEMLMDSEFEIMNNLYEQLDENDVVEYLV